MRFSTIFVESTERQNDLDLNLKLIIAVVKLKPERNSGLNGIRTHDLCDTGAVLYRLSYQAIWELVTLWVRNIPVESEECQ